MRALERKSSSQHRLRPQTEHSSVHTNTLETAELTIPNSGGTAIAGCQRLRRMTAPAEKEAAREDSCGCGCVSMLLSVEGQ